MILVSIESSLRQPTFLSTIRNGQDSKKEIQDSGSGLLLVSRRGVKAVEVVSGRHARLSLQLRATKAGGGYSGKKSSSNRLSKWSKQKWRTSDGKPSKGKKRYLPDKAWKALSASEKRATNRAKARGYAKGKQFVKQPKSIAKKVRKFRK